MNINIQLKFPVNPEFYAFFRLKMPDDLEIRCNDHADGHTAEEHAVPYPEFRIVLECFELEDPLAFGHRFLVPLLYVLRLLVVSAHEPGIQADDGDAAAVFTHFAVMDPERLVAHLLDLADGVADEEDRPALLAELLHAPDAFVGECIITDGECLVDDEHIRIGVDGDGEAEAGLHAARIILDRPVHEILELAEFDDIPILLVDLPLAHAVHQALHADVLFPRQLHVGPGGNRDERRLPVHFDAAGRRFRHPAEQVRQCRFPGAVESDDADGIPWLHIEGDILQRLVVLRLLLHERQDHVPQFFLVLRDIVDFRYILYTHFVFHILTSISVGAGDHVCPVQLFA